MKSEITIDHPILSQLKFSNPILKNPASAKCSEASDATRQNFVYAASSIYLPKRPLLVTIQIRSKIRSRAVHS
jgi:hypothetical protein